ncbi:MAG TPA: hypothetical protein VFA78_07440 [Chloroflexota bacterium]|nr:hypothetical protein [Chloroflexota bacterium]
MVRRGARSEVGILLQEARALELLADESDVPPDALPTYWDIAADLITLVADIEAFSAASPSAGYDQPELLQLRRRLREVSARLVALGG